MVTHSKIVDPLYILHENMKFLIFKKYVSDKYCAFNIFNNVLTNQSFMDEFFPFFSDAAGVVAEI
jgi:hypothetical protein